MINKVVTVEQAIEPIHDGARVMVGGSMALGSPELLIDALVQKNVRNLTVICNDGGIPGRGASKLIANGQVAHLITTHVGLNPKVTELCRGGKMDITLVPQGTFAERIRAGGAGLGGILTPTGIGTEVAEGKRTVEVDRKTYLLEEPLHADFALIRGSVVDTFGNVQYFGTTRCWNTLMATAADHVIASACKLVEKGKIDPHLVMTSGIFVDSIVEGEKEWNEVV